MLILTPGSGFSRSRGFLKRWFPSWQSPQMLQGSMWQKIGSMHACVSWSQSLLTQPPEFNWLWSKSPPTKCHSQSSLMGVQFQHEPAWEKLPSWCSGSRANVIRVTKHILIELKACFTRHNSCVVLSTELRICGWLCHKCQRRIYYYYSLNRVLNCPLNTYLHTYKFVQPSTLSERLLFAIDGN